MRLERGIALLLVMWLTMLLAAVVGTFALTAQMEKLQGRTLSRGVVAEQAARAGVEYALTRLTETDPKRRWLPDGRRYDWAFRSDEHWSETQSLMFIPNAALLLSNTQQNPH